MEAWYRIYNLLSPLVRDHQYYRNYLKEVNRYFGDIHEDERSGYFIHFLRHLTARLRTFALEGHADAFLEVPNLFHTIANMSNIRNCMALEEDTAAIIRRVKRYVKQDQDDELAYVVEEEFMKGMFKAIQQVHEEHKAERRRRIWAIREELIATVLHPDRACRIAAVHGMEPMDWLLQNEGYEQEGY
jgi:hypothetical protein